MLKFYKFFILIVAITLVTFLFNNNFALAQTYNYGAINQLPLLDYNLNQPDLPQSNNQYYSQNNQNSPSYVYKDYNASPNTGYAAPYNNFSYDPNYYNPNSYNNSQQNYNNQPYYSNNNSYEKQKLKNKLKNAALYGAIGAASGALLSPGKRGRNAAIGGGIGAAIGLLLGR